MVSIALETEIPSPCIGFCTLDRGGTCQGCGRTRAEIAGWQRAGAAQRLAVRARAAARLAAAMPER